jgi:hypothetical protein
VVRAQEITRSDGTIVRRKPREGDMRWDGKVWRRWNGRRWATAAYSAHPERLSSGSRLDLYPAMSPGAGRKCLSQAVEDQVVTNGASVVLDGERGVTLAYRRRTNHFAHAIMTGITMGLWAPVWIVATLIHREDRIRLTVDGWGNVWAQQVANP